MLSLGVAERPAPAEGQILVRVAAAGINRADVQQRKGFYPPPPGESEILGLEVSGTVEHANGCDGWSEGDECVALLAGGGYAEYVVVDGRHALPLPPGVDLVTAAGMLEVAATVVSNMDIARLSEGETFLVHGGAGGIGSFAIQYARSLGCTVATTAGSAEKLEFCRELGAEHAFDYHDDWVSAVKEIGGADVILDNMGAKYLMPNIDAMAKDGRMVVIGLMGGRKAELDLGKLLAKRGSVISTGLRARPADQKAAICAAVAERVWPRIADGTIRTAPTKVFDVADVAAAHEYFDSGDHRGKLVLKF
ncbi:NAD(P)H-quinone oxidoreductase [Mariniluteicoccus endophyticus]